VRFISVPGSDGGEGLKLELSLAESAFGPLLCAAWLKIAVSIAPAAAMRSSLTLLQGQLNITVAKQNLYCFWVSSNADQKRCHAVTQTMEAKSLWIIIYQSAFVVSVR